jgi:ATP-dependent DNA ligase
LVYIQDLTDGAWLYDAAITLKLEGIVGKHVGSLYRDGTRSQDWVKI